MDVAYPTQIAHKEEVVKEALVQFGVAQSQLLPAIEAKPQLSSRNKAKFIVGGNIEYPTLGMANASQETRDISRCPLHDPAIQKLVSTLKKLITEYRLSPYSIVKRKGELKAIIVRVGSGTGHLTVRFVARSLEMKDRIEAAGKSLCSEIPAVKVVSINIQPEPAAILEGPEELILTSTHFMEERLGGLRLSISPQSFSQVTSLVAEKLYNSAAEIISKAQPELMLDLFCGTGCFSLFSAKYCKKVVGVELSKSSILDAKRSAEWNGYRHLNFELNDVLKYLQHEFTDSPDLIVANPPRRGLGIELTATIQKLSPKAIVYSSCNIKSLVDDIKSLSKYQITSAQIFDMFPLTEHFETLVQLERI